MNNLLIKKGFKAYCCECGKEINNCRFAVSTDKKGVLMLHHVDCKKNKYKKLPRQ